MRITRSDDKTGVAGWEADKVSVLALIAHHQAPERRRAPLDQKDLGRMGIDIVLLRAVEQLTTAAHELEQVARTGMPEDRDARAAERKRLHEVAARCRLSAESVSRLLDAAK